MNHLTNLFHRRRSSRSSAFIAMPLILVSVLLSGCQTGAGSFSDIGLDWLDTSAAEPRETVVLARDPASLANGSAVERALYNAVELSRQKRFTEAGNLLADVRSIQDMDSEGYRSISTAMALISLRRGDIGAFRRIARQLDNSLGRPVRVDQAYVDVISLYRVMDNRNLPVNAKDEMKTLKEKFFATKSAKL